MPAYTTISNALVAVGAKPFATTMQALRDNPLAIAEGDATAPRILDAALDTGAATAAGITWVGLRTASLALGAVGSYAFLAQASANVAITAGTTYAGSGLRYGGVFGTSSGVASVTASGGTPAGTWRAMGTAGAASGQNSSTLFLRIS